MIVHGNSLSLQEYGHWFTPAHILGLWHYKLKRRRREREAMESGGPEQSVEGPKPEPTPEKPKESGGPGKLIIGEQMDFNL